MGKREFVFGGGAHNKHGKRSLRYSSTIAAIIILL
jgi:hypothetical protein